MDLEKKYLDAIERNENDVEVKSISNLKEFTQFYLDKYRGTKKRFDVDTVIHMTEILQGSKEDYLIFDSAEGQLFSIWKGTEIVTNMVENNRISNMNYAYAYRLRGQDYIVNPFVRGEVVSYSD